MRGRAYGPYGVRNLCRGRRLSHFFDGATIGCHAQYALLIEATPAEDFTVDVRFEDGLAANVDLSYLLDYGGVFEPLKEVEYFCQLRADGEAGTIVWPNKADIAPETLYAHARRCCGI